MADFDTWRLGQYLRSHGVFDGDEVTLEAHLWWPAQPYVLH